MGGEGSGRVKGGGRWSKPRSKEEVAQIRMRLQGELEAARKLGESQLARNIGHKIRYWEEKEKTALPGQPGQIPSSLSSGPAPAAASQYPDLASLLAEAAKYEAGLTETLREMSLVVGKEIKAGSLTKTLLSIGIMLAWKKRVTPQHLEKADLFCLGGGAVLLILENWAAFKKEEKKGEPDKDDRDKSDIGGGAKPVG